MKVNRTNMYSTSFQAKIPNHIRTKILKEAEQYGSKALNDTKNQIANVEKWGHPASQICTAIDIEKNDMCLGLSNLKISKMYLGGFKQKSSLYDTFMSLKENDIIKAEESVQKEVNNSKFDLISKALKDNKLMQKITGEANSSAKKLVKDVDKLSEDDIANLRFGLDDSSKYGNDEPLNFDF